MQPLHRHDTQITPAAAGHDGNARSIPVWDLVVRIFHWSVVAGVLANYVFLEAGKAPHRYVGYAVAGALAVRVVWGFVGSTHARFADFVTTPRAAALHIASAAAGRDRRYVGHNPAGGLMMLALMALLAAVCITGWMQGLDRFWGEQWLQTTHALLVDAVLVMAALHVTAALVESRRHRENLVLAMVTGRKRAASETDVDHAAAAHRR
ncbi:cytochrome B [Burkholderia vietnamiensis]|uniref:cytochrome b/b6 domain-containing protein n=1 Tax=Burkholderia vietnamiensis TaxID=60552 RepID=UPI0007549266|nr:cytochrome b/b6 domain-containing protein [Burkholderia vietnamiensis]KVF17498.1 cytochrome B [Burkholderia vietnamiensis]